MLTSFESARLGSVHGQTLPWCDKCWVRRLLICKIQAACLPSELVPLKVSDDHEVRASVVSDGCADLCDVTRCNLSKYNDGCLGLVADHPRPEYKRSRYVVSSKHISFSTARGATPMDLSKHSRHILLQKHERCGIFHKPYTLSRILPSPKPIERVALLNAHSTEVLYSNLQARLHLRRPSSNL